MSMRRGDKTQLARLRYIAANARYQEAARRVSRQLRDGTLPAAEDTAAESAAQERLTDARKALIGAMLEEIGEAP